MARIYKTAMGKPVDMDLVRLSNENVIALGNMKVNARGDELGPGGKVIKTRAEIMQDYHKLRNVSPVEDIPLDSTPTTDIKLAQKFTPAQPTNTNPSRVRGSLAEEVAATTKPTESVNESQATSVEVTTELLKPTNKVKRI